MIEFRAWPKIARLNRDVVITEKLDGTNAAVIVDEDCCTVAAQSRSRLITPADDNHGFAKWVNENAANLANTLGPGHHFGEWWGSGIQRGYGLPKGEKRFSLFNTKRWRDVVWSGGVPGLCCVPTLYRGPFFHGAIQDCLKDLRERGSYAAPFMNPEGLVIYHTAANMMFKVTLENDAAPKSAA